MSTYTSRPEEEAAAEVQTPPSATEQDESCAIFVRNALFPFRRDYGTSNKNHQHHHIHPALTVLDRLRHDLLEKQETPFSSLFPPRVILVPSHSGGEMDWNGQPDLSGNGAAVEVVPNVLSVQCMECKEVIKSGVQAFWRSKPRYDGTEESELVVCSDRVLKRDYQKSAAVGKPARVLLDERKDLPPHSMKVVEEVLAHELSKLRVVDAQESNLSAKSSVTIAASSKTMPCEAYAKAELMAAKAAECMYEVKEGEIRRGSRLGWTGFSLLPLSLQQTYQDNCVQHVAKEFTAKEFGGKEARRCVEQAWKAP